MDIKLKGNEQTTVTLNPENALVGVPAWTVVTGTSATVVPEADGKSAIIAAVPDECGTTIIRVKAVCTNPAFVAAKVAAEKLEKETEDLAKPKAVKTEVKTEKQKSWETKTETKAEKTEVKKAEVKDVLPPETLTYVEEFFVSVTNTNPTSSLRIGITEPVPIPQTPEPLAA